jgi:ribosome-associated protein
MVAINDTLDIPDSELTFSASRSGGPGGQNVNKVNSKILLEFNVGASAVLSEEQKARIRQKLATRISGDDVLQVTAQENRTQHANRETAVAKFAALLRAALTEQKKRRKTRVSLAAKERRIVQKKQIGEKKRGRTAKQFD